MKKTWIIFLLLLLPVFVFSQEEDIWQGLSFGMTYEEVAAEVSTEMEEVDLPVSDLLTRYKTTMAIGNLEDVLILFDFFQDHLFRIVFYEAVSRYDSVELYETIQSRLSQRWGEPAESETHTPDPYDETHWNRDLISILYRGGFKESRWSITEENGLMLKLPGMPVQEQAARFVIIKWAYVDLETEEIVDLLLENPPEEQEDGENEQNNSNPALIENDERQTLDF